MNNEQLATLILQGGNDELLPILWENVRKLLYCESEKYYRLNKNLCDSRGVDDWDIKQVSYTAFLKALRAFDSASGYKFTSYLKYPFKTAVNELLGVRTVHSNKEPLNNFASLEKPIEQPNGDTVTLNELIPDNTALDFIEDVDRTAEAETVRQIVDALSEPCKSVITAYYFQGITFTRIAESMNLSKERVRQIHLRALKILRNNEYLREMYGDYRRHYNWLSVARFQHSPEYFEICSKLNERLNITSAENSTNL